MRELAKCNQRQFIGPRNGNTAISRCAYFALLEHNGASVRRNGQYHDCQTSLKGMNLAINDELLEQERARQERQLNAQLGARSPWLNMCAPRKKAC